MSLKRHRQKEDFSLDLTTCSDIIFTLLLFYILTQNFIPQTPLELPSMENAEQLENDSYVRIEIAQNGIMSWNTSEFTLDNIPNFANQSKPIIIFAHELSPSGICIELLDRLRKQKIKAVSFAGKIKNKE